jgi:N-dimethylarginine dimethylaminohydrolase
LVYVFDPALIGAGGMIPLRCGKPVGVTLVPVPDDEYATLGCNILAVRPGVVIVVDGNPQTRRMLERHGCEVHPFDGGEICLNGSGGPTCLTRPILRSRG